MDTEYCYKCKGFIPRGYYSQCRFSNKDNIDGRFNHCVVLRGASCKCNFGGYKEEHNIFKLFLNNIFK